VFAVKPAETVAQTEAPLFTVDFASISLEPFAALPAELWTESFFRANELANAYVDVRARDVVHAMSNTAGAIDPARRAPWEWIQRKLARRRGPLPPSQEFRQRLTAERPDLRAVVDLVDRAADGYPSFFAGTVDGASILFDRAHPGLWDAYFSNSNPLYAAGNVLAAHAAALSIEKSAGALRVLEVGAGLGSAAEKLLEGMGPAIASYLLTDVSPGFLRKARERLESGPRREGAQLRFQLLDLGSPPGRWPAPPGEFDLVFAVNVLHAVPDLIAALRGLRERLAPGGSLVLGECVRPAPRHPVHPEFIFLLLEEFRGARLDPSTRPEAGFLDAGSWHASLGAAGFRSVQLIPDFPRAVAAYGEHSLAAIIATAD
jgi:SAM-dependent methyltransferase